MALAGDGAARDDLEGHIGALVEVGVDLVVGNHVALENAGKHEVAVECLGDNLSDLAVPELDECVAL